MMKHVSASVSVVLGCALLAAALAQAQTKPAGEAPYPVKPIRIVVPFTPGGSADIFARVIGQKMTENWGQQVVVDNRPGSGGVIGSEAAARAPADGYTLMLGITANIAINPALYRRLPYDPAKDFAPVTMVATAPYALVMPPAMPTKNVKELIALAKSRPNEIAYVSLGNGSAGHLTAELFASMAGIKLIHVPYKSIGPAITDVIAGHVQMFFIGMVSAQPHIRSGKLRAVGVTSPKRSPLMPAVPAIAEALPGYEVAGWYGVFVPAGTPVRIVNQLQREVARILALPDVRERLSAEGAELVGDTPEQFAAYINRELVKWQKVVQISGARAD